MTTFTFACTPSDMHPYNCAGPGHCIHCDHTPTAKHNPDRCVLCLNNPAAKETEVTFTNTDPRPRPEGVLTVTGELTQEQADAVLAEWEKFLADNPTDGAYTIAGVEVTYRRPQRRPK